MLSAMFFGNMENISYQIWGLQICIKDTHLYITVSTEFRYDAFCQLVLLDYNQDKSNEYGKLILKDSEITALHIFPNKIYKKKKNQIRAEINCSMILQIQF